VFGLLDGLEHSAAFTMDRSLLVARQLADALLAGPADVEGFVERAAHCLGRRHRWLAAFCRRAFQRFGSAGYR
jgi:hypothetical protein